MFHRVLFAVLVVTSNGWGGERLIEGTSLHFADVEAGRERVAARDAFLTSLSRLDRQVRLQTDGEATEAALIEFLRGEVISWEDAARQKLVDSIARIRPKLEPFQLPLPETIFLVAMSGKEESQAAYTRGTAIFLPRDRIAKLGTDGLDRLLLHELFHVLSRHAPELRRDLYRFVGFEVCDSITLPPGLADLKLTNPDAPLIDCRIRLNDDGGMLDAAPILYSSSETYDATAKPPLFKYLTFRLMQAEQHEGRWRPVLADGKPNLIDPASSKSFSEQIGANTKYIIHPDEILADNFVHVVMQTEKLPTPRLIEQLRERLLSAPRP